MIVRKRASEEHTLSLNDTNHHHDIHKILHISYLYIIKIYIYVKNIYRCVDKKRRG